MIVAAAAAHRVLLRAAQPREGLAGIENAAAGAGDGVHETPRDGGGGREQLQEIERGALAREYRPRGPGDLAKRLSGGDALAVARAPGEAHLRVETAEGLLRPRPPAEHRLLARNDGAAHALRRGHESCGHIAATDVLAQRRIDLGGEIRGQLGHYRPLRHVRRQ